jgi:hypothetical protein
VPNPILEQLQTLTIAELVRKITAKEATAADLAVARAILKDNNIQVLPEANPQLTELKESLPFDPEAARRAG